MRYLLVLILLFATSLPAAEHKLSVTVTSPLAKGPIPFDPLIDFGKFIKPPSRLDPNSIEVRDAATSKIIPSSLGKGFRYGDSGRVRWVAHRASQTKFEIRFRSAGKRPLLQPKAITPMIGVGDMLRYNASKPMPIALRYPSRLVDINGDGRLDLIGTQPHRYSPRSPYGGIVCYPNTSRSKEKLTSLEFGDMVRLRFTKGGRLHHFSGPYLVADVVDLNKDGLPDLLYSTTKRTARFQPDRTIHHYGHVYLNTGKRDAGGMPVFKFAMKFPLPKDPDFRWGPIRAADINGDGSLDIIIGGMYEDQSPIAPASNVYFLANTNRAGWPLKLKKPAKVKCSRRACFLDMDGDGRLDCIGLGRDPDAATVYRANIITWRRNLGGDPPRFGREQHFRDHKLNFSTYVSAVHMPGLRGIIFNDKRDFSVTLLEQPTKGSLKFRKRVLRSKSAHIVAGDQAAPYPVDWDGDGDWDLVVGGGNGWPQVIVNVGNNQSPAFKRPQQFRSGGKPIRIFMSQVFPGIEGYGHDMGYPFPSVVDWNHDGRLDLMMPNITNRVFWYPNIGTAKSPQLGGRQQVVVHNRPETKQTIEGTAKLLGAGTGGKWNKRMLDPNSPFGWRAKAGFADFNNDGLIDMVHADGRTRSSSGYAAAYSLFLRYRDNKGELRLRPGAVIKLPNGKPLPPPGGITSQAIPADWDNDGRIDLICHYGPSNMNCQPMFVRNIGTKSKPKFDFPKPLKLWGKPLFNLMKHGPYWAVYDFDGDGKLDLLAGCAYGNYTFYRRTAMDMSERPSLRIEGD